MPNFILNRPRILKAALPSAGRSAALVLERSLIEMETVLLNFSRALELFDACDPAKKQSRALRASAQRSSRRATCDEIARLEDVMRLSSWRNMAVRDGVMQIGKLGRLIVAAQLQVKDLPRENARIDHAGITKSARMMERNFPGHGAICDAVAKPASERRHAAVSPARASTRYERWGFRTDARTRGNAITGIAGRSFFVGNGKTVRRYELSQRSLDCLVAAVGRFFDSFPD